MSYVVKPSHVKSNSDKFNILEVMIMIILVMIICTGITLGLASSYYRAKAIENEAAKYNQTTGCFEWNNK